MLGRTALWDIHDEAPYAAALDALGPGPDLVPPRVAAGAALGRVRADHPVEQVRGAVLTVAGHDHLVAAAALGAGGVGSLCDSMGTAEALVAAVAAPPSPRVVAGLVARGLSVYPHVVDSTTCLLGALRTGLVLGRTLDDARGHHHRAAARVRRRRRPRAREPADVTVEGLDMADDHVTVAWPEGTDPYAAWAGVLARTREVVASEVAAMRAVGVPVDDVVVTGGWAHLPSVAASRVGIAERTHARGDGRAGDDGSGAVRAVGGHPASGGVGPDHARGAAGGLVHRPVGLEWLPMTDTATRPEDEVVRICQELIRIDTSNYGDGSGPGEAQAAGVRRRPAARGGARAADLRERPRPGQRRRAHPRAPTASAARCACTATSTSCPPTPPTGRSTRSPGRSATAASGAAARST